MAAINCPSCGSEIPDTAQFCMYCGTHLDHKIKKHSNKRTAAFIIIAVCVVLVVLSVLLVTTDNFRYFTANMKYFSEEYKENLSMSAANGNNFLGSTYYQIASGWKSLQKKAIIYIVLHCIGAVILASASGVGLYYGLKMIKNNPAEKKQIAKCPSCGSEVSGTAQFCMYCGYNLHTKRPLFRKANGKGNIKKKIKKPDKRVILVAAAVVEIALIVTSCLSLFGGSVELNASKYIKKTEAIDDVETINGVVCVAKKYYGHKRSTLGYLVFYTTEDGSDFAYFEKGKYEGNGSNGGEAKEYGDALFYNLHAGSAFLTAMDFIQDDSVLLIPGEKHYKTDEGVVYVKMDDFTSWANNYVGSD